MSVISQYDDIIDSLNLEQEIRVYEAWREFGENHPDDNDYLDEIKRLFNEASENTDDPEHFYLVRYSYAEEFVQDFCEGAFGLKGDEFIYSYIDWERVTEDLMPVTVTFFGVEYRIGI